MKKSMWVMVLAGTLFIFPSCEQRDNDSASEQYKEEGTADQDKSGEEGAEDQGVGESGRQN